MEQPGFRSRRKRRIARDDGVVAAGACSQVRGRSGEPTQPRSCARANQAALRRVQLGVGASVAPDYLAIAAPAQDLDRTDAVVDNVARLQRGNGPALGALAGRDLVIAWHQRKNLLLAGIIAVPGWRIENSGFDGEDFSLAHDPLSRPTEPAGRRVPVASCELRRTRLGSTTGGRRIPRQQS